jgi:Skp family chaperone for outer membrane proteins
VKKAIFSSILFAAVGAGIYLGPLVLAQQPAKAPEAPVKVAVVNFRAVLKKNAQASALQAQLEATLKPHKEKAKALADLINAAPEAKTAPWVLQVQKDEWEKVNAEIIRLIEETHKEKMPAVWAEINQAVEWAARTYGFQVVLACSDPDDPDVKAFHTVKASKLDTTDKGCMVALYVHPSVDLTPVIIYACQNPAVMKGAGGGK